MRAANPLANLGEQAARPNATPDFDRVARLYRWAEYAALGPLLKRTREQFLPEITAARHALLLGDGDGRFAAALLRRAPQVQVHAVDASAGMLQLLRVRCQAGGTAARLTVQQAPVQGVVAPPGCDLVVTHFLLDCLPQDEIEALAIRLARAVAPGCRWLVSEFGLPRRRPWRGLAAIYIRLLYAVFRVLTGLRPQHLPDPQRALARAGFERLHRHERLHGFLYSELWELPLADPVSSAKPDEFSGQPAKE